ncbi:MAG TPA: YdiU family protein [Desulfonatronum sp.]|nr:YdiU family protein [Desulfonatronum sp.]
MTDTIAEAGWNFDNTYARLPEAFFARLDPVPVRAPRLVILNRPLAQELGLNAPNMEKEGAGLFSGNRIPHGALPLAQAYAGHQFGHFTMLGDGRAILLGEHLAPDGRRFDIQLKGSGRTPFSRGGDGRAVLGPMLREYIISETLHGLGIPTSRSLAVVATGESVFRETALPGAVLTRVAASHLRVGTFEYAAFRGNFQDLKTLADYVIRRHYPDAVAAASPYCSLLAAVMQRQARLIAQWQCVGFIHGVMNTDNTALSGETMDYGPCAFMDAYDLATVFSSIDHQGRYAYGNQPRIMHWNLTRFAETLLPLLAPDQATAVRLAREILAAFFQTFRAAWLAGMRAKLGLTMEEAKDEALVQDLLDCMHRTRADFTNTWRELALKNLPSKPIFRDAAFLEWMKRWRDRLQQQSATPEEVRTLMQAHSPAVIPRNHRVEEALDAANNEDFTIMERLLAILTRPYDNTPGQEEYRSPPPPSWSGYRTFCGT